MSDRADFLAGIAASGFGSMYGIYGDFGTFSGPYPDPSPPGDFFDAFEYDMSDNYDSSGIEGSSDDDVPVYKSKEQPKTRKSVKTRKKPKSQRKSKSKKRLKAQLKSERTLDRLRMIHRYLGKEICEDSGSLSEQSKQYLARLANDACYRYRSSFLMRLEHLRSTANILTPAGFTLYAKMFHVDKRVEALVNQLASTEEALKEKPTNTPLMKSFKELREREMLQNLSTSERRDVKGLLSLLMRTSESVARRSWPQKQLCSLDCPGAEPKDRAKVKQVTKIRRKMERDERLLDELRGCIELGWPDHNSIGPVRHLSTPVLIDKVRSLGEEVLRIGLLPSTACILHVIDIIRRAPSMEELPMTEDRCDMPVELMEELEWHLGIMDDYDDWRATNPPDSECFADYMLKL